MRFVGAFIAIAAICLIYACAAQAQVAADASASVTIVGGLSITTVSNISFGTVTAGDGTITVDPTTAPTGTASVGQFLVSGTRRTDIAATYPNTIVLTEPDGSNTLTYTTSVVTEDNNDASTASAYISGSTVQLDNDGNRYFWVGGDVTVGPSTAGGTYTGIFTLTVSYN